MQGLARFLVILLIVTFSPVVLSDQNEDLATFKLAYMRYEELSKQGDLKKSLPQARLAYELGKQLFGKESKEAAKLVYNYGNNLLRLQLYNETESVLIEALSSFEKIYGTESIELIPVLLDLAYANANTNKDNIKKKLYARAFKLYEQEYGKESVEFAWFSVRTGADMMYFAHDKAGEKSLKAGYEILRSKLGDDHEKTGFAAYNLGKYELSLEHYEAAKPYLLIALKSYEKPDAPPSKGGLSTHAFLVRVYEELGESELASQHSLAIGRMTPFESTQSYFPIYKKNPIYPKSALRQGKEGYVVVEFTVDEKGFVRDPHVIAIEGGQVFEQPALDAVKTFRYAPRFIDGQPVAVEGVQNKLYFSMK
jgi:TonB family protein